ncbi:MAG: hypothetical protein KDD42_02670, partial [Bdellovibrionales bacterium]|nr:hypothetical protein [Bdellovibrionales bacterium]
MNRNKFIAFFASLALLCGAAVTPSAANADVADYSTPGSFLIFPKFDIRGDRSTQLRIVNNHWRDSAVKLNYVCPGEKHVNEFCASLDRLVDFTGYQTRIIDVADQNPPCEQGFVVAFAYKNGRPVAYNHLTGSYHVTDGHRHEGDNAVAVQSTQEDGATLGSNGQLRFGYDSQSGGQDYLAL